MNLLLKCPNKECKYNYKPSRSMFVKKGKHNRDGVLIQRYRCQACGTTFNQNSVGGAKHFRKDLEMVKDLFRRYTSGYSLANLSKDLRISKKTALRYLEELASLCRRYHQAYMSNGFLRTRFVFLDEMETFVVSKKYPHTISLAVDVGYKRIISAYVHEIKTKGKLKTEVLLDPEKFLKALLQRYNSPLANEKSMCDIKRCLIPIEAKIYTDGKTEYPALIEKHFPQGVEHVPQVFDYKDIENLPPYVLRYGSIQAWLRTNSSRLGRKSQITSKKRKHLEDHLMLMIARYNNYDLDEVLNFDRFEHNFYEHTKKIKDDQKLLRVMLATVFYYHPNKCTVREYRPPKLLVYLLAMKLYYQRPPPVLKAVA